MCMCVCVCVCVCVHVCGCMHLHILLHHASLQVTSMTACSSISLPAWSVVWSPPPPPCPWTSPRQGTCFTLLPPSWLAQQLDCVSFTFITGLLSLCFTGHIWCNRYMSFTPITVLFLTASLDTIKVLYFSRLQKVCLFHICHNIVSYGFTGHYLVFTSAAGLSFSHLSQFCFLLLQWTLLYFSHLQQVCLFHICHNSVSYCFTGNYYIFHICNRSVFFTSVTILFLIASLDTIIFFTSATGLSFTSVTVLFLTASLDTIKVLCFSRLQQVCLLHICHNSVSYSFTRHFHNIQKSSSFLQHCCTLLCLWHPSQLSFYCVTGLCLCVFCVMAGIYR